MASLDVGTRLGVYEILGALGHGGMGEVYRARDARLNRDVAIKVLPHAFASDAGRRARFEREAQVLASINHPHIAAIYGLEESSGISALVMELVDGPTLADRIAASPIPIDDAIAIARQIADALEAAHDKGIIHRDLKPANIKLDAERRVKVLDFGLAKALDPEASGSNLSMSPTLTSPAMTAVGTLMGTAAYMAPEQARGAAVDKRADIWAFGVVFFEMLIGKQLFEGETLSDTLASVLRQEIDWTALPPTTPAAVTQLLRRAVERDPKLRLRDIGEARITLEAVGSGARRALSPNDTPQVAAPRAHRRFGLVHGVVAVLTLALVAATVGLWRVTHIQESQVVRLAAPMPGGISFNLLNRPMIAISRDGSTMAIVGSAKGIGQLYVRPLDEFEPRPLPGTQNASGPFFSPDGAWIGFFADGKLKKTPASGGAVIALADASDARGAVWTDADTIIFAPEFTGGLHEVQAAGGAPRPISTIDEKKHERTHRWPSLLPDGKTVLFNVGSIAHPDDYDDATLEAIRLDTGVRSVVLKGGRMGRYLSTGDLLFLRGRILYATGFDPSRLEVRGSPRPMVDGVSGDTTTGAAHYSVSDTGTLAYVPDDSSGTSWRLVWIDRQGKTTALDAAPALYTDPHVAPDGRRIAVTIIDPTNSNKDIWIVNTTRGTSSRLTFQGVNRTPIWSHDGQRVYYAVYDRAKNTSVVTVKAADGSGSADRLRELPGQVYLHDLSPDDATMVLRITGLAGDSKIYRMATKGDARDEPKPLTAGLTPDTPMISADGRWLAYSATDTGRAEVYVQSFASGSSRSQVSANGGLEPRWAPDGRALYYRENDSVVMVPIESGSVFIAGRPVALFGGLLPMIVDSGQTYHIAPGGDRFVVMRPVDDAAATPAIRIALNWLRDLGLTSTR